MMTNGDRDAALADVTATGAEVGRRERERGGYAPWVRPRRTTLTRRAPPSLSRRPPHQAARLLRAGGSLVVVTHTQPDDDEPLPEHDAGPLIGALARSRADRPRGSYIRVVQRSDPGSVTRRISTNLADRPRGVQRRLRGGVENTPDPYAPCVAGLRAALPPHASPSLRGALLAGLRGGEVAVIMTRRTVGVAHQESRRSWRDGDGARALCVTRASAAVGPATSGRSLTTVPRQRAAAARPAACGMMMAWRGRISRLDHHA